MPTALQTLLEVYDTWAQGDARGGRPPDDASYALQTLRSASHELRRHGKKVLSINALLSKNNCDTSAPVFPPMVSSAPLSAVRADVACSAG